MDSNWLNKKNIKTKSQPIEKRIMFQSCGNSESNRMIQKYENGRKINLQSINGFLLWYQLKDVCLSKPKNRMQIEKVMNTWCK